MKTIKILVLLLSVLFLFSCSKQADSLSGNGPKITVNMNGETKSYSEASGGISVVTGVKVYTFVAGNNQADSYFQLSVVSQDLKPGSYSLNTGVVNYRKGSTVVSNVSNSNFTLVVTSNNDNTVTGSFSGVLDNLSNSSQVNISGTINGVQLIK